MHYKKPLDIIALGVAYICFDHAQLVIKCLMLFTAAFARSTAVNVSLGRDTPAFWHNKRTYPSVL